MARAEQVLSRPEGWKFAGRAGDFHVWHAGKNDYRITDGAAGDVIATRTQFGLAHERARREDHIRRSDAISDYYTDRAKSGHAALAGHR